MPGLLLPPLLLLLLQHVGSVAGDATVSTENRRDLKNILLIIADDLRPNVGSYGVDFMRTPHLDALAESGTLFERAYVQYSFCAPSRNSFMSGRRPDRTRAFNFIDDFRETGVGDSWTAMPEYFRRHNYTVFGTGKLFVSVVCLLAV